MCRSRHWGLCLFSTFAEEKGNGAGADICETAIAGVLGLTVGGLLYRSVQDRPEAACRPDTGCKGSLLLPGITQGLVGNVDQLSQFAVVAFAEPCLFLFRQVRAVGSGSGEVFVVDAVSDQIGINGAMVPYVCGSRRSIDWK